MVFGAGIGLIFNHISLGAELGILFSILIAEIMYESREDSNRSVVRVMVISVLGAAVILLIPKIIVYFL